MLIMDVINLIQNKSLFIYTYKYTHYTNLLCKHKVLNTNYY